jgi:hypothetical protein
MLDLEPVDVSVTSILSKLKTSLLSSRISIELHGFNFYKTITFFYYQHPRMEKAQGWFVRTARSKVLERVVQFSLSPTDGRHTVQEQAFKFTSLHTQHSSYERKLRFITSSVVPGKFQNL